MATVNPLFYLFIDREFFMRNSMQKGFTLIELMIVIAIIGVLAAVAVPAYQDYIAKAQTAEAASLSDGIRTEVALSFSQDNVCPDNSSAAKGNIDKAANIKGKYIKSVTTGETAAPTKCTVTALYATTGVNSKLSGKKFVYTLTTGTNNVSQWACTSDVDASILPKTCEPIAAASSGG